MKHKKKLIVAILAALLIAPLFSTIYPPMKQLASYFRPQLLIYYFSNPAMRDLIHLIAGNRLQAFPTVWDTSEGILLSKKLFRPVDMNGVTRYGYLPHLKKLSFQTGTRNFQRKFEAPDTPQLRDILAKLETPWITEASFDENGFRQTGYAHDSSCEQTVLFAGDSFTEGLWVNDPQTFVSLFAAAVNQAQGPKTCAINTGTNGYGALEESFTAQTYYPKFKYQTLFVIHHPNDIHRDAFFLLQNKIPDGETYWKRHLEELAKLTAFAKDHGVRLILVPIPPKEQFAMPETRENYQRRLAEFCRDHGLEFWDPFEVLKSRTWEEIYLDWDPHFNPSGHRIFADFIIEKFTGNPGQTKP